MYTCVGAQVNGGDSTCQRAVRNVLGRGRRVIKKVGQMQSRERMVRKEGQINFLLEIERKKEEIHERTAQQR